ncbi:MAG: hypothetical protein Kow0025_20510 [Thermodesulfovibrionales bacterium]
MKVLVVDDEQLVRWFLERALSKRGYGVTTAGNAQDALGLLEKGGYDVLFTDLKMPGDDGASLIRKVMESEGGPRIVVCSAFVTSELAEEFGSKGIITIKKPFRLSELEEALRKVLSRDLL